MSPFIFSKRNSFKHGKKNLEVFLYHEIFDLLNIPNINYDPKLVKIKFILKQLEKRDITPICKITVIKTLVLPLLNNTCILMSIPNSNAFYCKKSEKLLFSFLWRGSTHIVKRVDTRKVV